MVPALMVALGGAAGGALRYSLSGLVARRIGETFPWGTLFINVSGCFAIGAIAPLLPEASLLRAVVLTGLLGGYTTVSSFSLQTVALMREGQWLAALGNCVLSVALTFAAAGAGMLVARGFAAA